MSGVRVGAAVDARATRRPALSLVRGPAREESVSASRVREWQRAVANALAYSAAAVSLLLGWGLQAEKRATRVGP